MGCHTLFYTKAEPQPTLDDLYTRMTSHLSTQIGYYGVMLKLTDKDSDEVDGLTFQLRLNERMLRAVEQGKATQALKNKCSEYTGYEYAKETDTFYIETDWYDVFRFGCTEKKLFSFEETITFFNENKVLYSPGRNYKEDKQQVIQLMKQFWEENPEGMVCFG